jgi:hypothetical protein
MLGRCAALLGMRKGEVLGGGGLCVCGGGGGSGSVRLQREQQVLACRRSWLRWWSTI